MLKRIFVVLIMVVLGWAFFPLMSGLEDRAALGELANEYVTDGPDDLGAANLVTSVVVSYRGLDTLGEVTVLFAAAAGVGLVFQFKRNKKKEADTNKEKVHPPSEILKSASGLLFPMIFIFGIYIFVHGHLTPGGGFQGGVVIASAILLAFMSGAMSELNHGLAHFLEMFAGVAYVSIGLLGIWLAAGFLDPRFLPSGQFGSLFSAGAIPVIYSLVGIKVGAELSGVIDVMRGNR